MSNEIFVIEKNVPMVQPNAVTVKIINTISSMEKGDSFTVPLGEITKTTLSTYMVHVKKEFDGKVGIKTKFFKNTAGEHVHMRIWKLS